MKMTIDLTRWMDPCDDYAVEMLAPGSPLLPMVQDLERNTLVNLVAHVRMKHREDTRAVALLLEAIDETCGTQAYRDVLRELGERESIGDLIKQMAGALIGTGEDNSQVGAA
ncbi:MAG: hypothetical protein IT345_12030 [Trueperaceae bacterium]|nr:hypothetical protein [Trueperaceae bacterium]